MSPGFPLRAGLALLILPILGLLGMYFLELGEVRECVLAGGHWDYRAGICRETPQPFASLLQRHPGLVNGGLLLSVAGLVLCLVGLYTKRR